MTISNVRAYGIGYIMRRQVHKKGLLRHEKVGCPSASNPIAGEAGSEGISGGDGGCSRWFWWELFSRAKVGKVHGSCVGLSRKGR